MKILMFITLLCFNGIWLAAQDYSVLKLNKDLVPGADAIVRNDFTHINLISAGEAVIKRTHAITILNAENNVLWVTLNSYTASWFNN